MLWASRADRKRAGRGLFRALLFVVTTAGQAGAHHNVGHGPSDSLKNLSTLAGDPSPRQRAAIMGQVARGTDEPSLNTATASSVTGLLDIQLHERFYLLGQFPLLFVDEDSTDQLKAGYGDTTVGAYVPLGDLDKASASWVVGINVDLPTRTLRYEADPGNQWTVAPGLRYGDAHKSFLWYALLLLPVENRPAGTALDVSPAGGIGYRFFRKLSVTGGINADIRALTVCKTFDGSEICPGGRATEVNRPQGAVRAYGHVGLSYDIHKNWSLFTGGIVPLTSRRDIEWAVNLGIEARF